MLRSFFWILVVGLIASCAFEQVKTSEVLSEEESENSDDMVAEEDSDNLLDILIVASVPYQERKMAGLHNPIHREKNKRHADAVVNFLQALPAKVADHDYQIAIMNRECISPIITSSSKPNPKTNLVKTFWQLPGDTEVAQFLGHADLLDNVMTGLTDIRYTGVSHRQMPVAGTEMTDPVNGLYEYEKGSEKGVVTERLRGNLRSQYRQLASGLVVVDYLDDNDDAKCNKPWIRKNSKLVIVGISILPKEYLNFPLCSYGGLCTMPDIETALRDLGKLSGKGETLQRRYRFYGITDKEGTLYKNPYNIPSRRPAVRKIQSILLTAEDLLYRWAENEKYAKYERMVYDVAVDWDDFKSYQIRGSDQKLVDYLADVNSRSERKRILDGIANFAEQD